MFHEYLVWCQRATLLPFYFVSVFDYAIVKVR
jgi:hypothetical protein